MPDRADDNHTLFRKANALSKRNSIVNICNFFAEEIRLQIRVLPGDLQSGLTILEHHDLSADGDQRNKRMRPERSFACNRDECLAIAIEDCGDLSAGRIELRSSALNLSTKGPKSVCIQIGRDINLHASGRL